MEFWGRRALAALFSSLPSPPLRQRAPRACCPLVSQGLLQLELLGGASAQRGHSAQ